MWEDFLHKHLQLRFLKCNMHKWNTGCVWRPWLFLVQLYFMAAQKIIQFHSSRGPLWHCRYAKATELSLLENVKHFFIFVFRSFVYFLFLLLEASPRYLCHSRWQPTYRKCQRCLWAGEGPDSNPGQLYFSQARYHWATSQKLWAFSPYNCLVLYVSNINTVAGWTSWEPTSQDFRAISLEIIIFNYQNWKCSLKKIFETLILHVNSEYPL